MHATQLIPVEPATQTRPFAGSQGDLLTEVNYIDPPKGRNVIQVRPEGEGQSERNATYKPTLVSIKDGRDADEVFSLDRQGFQLGAQVTRVRSFHDDEEVRRVYYPEMESLIKSVTGAKGVLIFDHTVRISGGDGSKRMPVKAVHNDYTLKSGPQRVRDLVGGADAARLLRRRFSIVNVWRSIAGTVRNAPLGLVDAGSVAPDDLIPTDLIYTDRVGEIYEVASNPEHRWYYYPQMEQEEVLFIKGYDSHFNKAQFTPHSAFDIPGTRNEVAARQSVEIRALVFH